MPLKTTIIAFLLLFILMPVAGQDLKVMSYNIKYDNTSDTINNWNFRKEAMVTLLKKHAPAIIGMQEVLHGQLEYLNVALPNHDYIGIGRKDGKQAGEYSPIFYNSKKYKVVKSNTFWLSKTPEIVSTGWDASLERICTNGLFENLKTGKRFLGI